MIRRSYSSLTTYRIKLGRLSMLSKLYGSTVHINYNGNRRSRTLYDIKHRCYLQRMSVTGNTYSGIYCALEQCREEKDMCINCRYSSFI